MTNDNGKSNNQEIQSKEPKQIQLVITVMPDGKVNVSGPIKDRMFCYGLLEIAKEVISDFRYAKKIEIPNNLRFSDFLRSKFK